MSRRISAATAIVCALALASCTGSPALAADSVVTPPTTAVVLPYGEWIVAVGQTFTSILLPALVGIAMTAIYQVAPWARLFISQSLVERLVRNVTDYGLNAVAGAVKGREVDVPTGSAVIAKAAQRAVDQAPSWLLREAGGPQGVAEKVFRALHLEDGATAANTLAPALAAVPKAT